MRVLSSLALFGFITVATFAQTQSHSVYRIHKLMLTSTDLPPIESHATIHAFQGGTYNLDELAERIRSKIRDQGYPLVEVGAVQITHLRSTPHACTADVRYSVHAASRYWLGEITFHIRPGGSVFTSTQLRAQFPIQNGAMFSASKMGVGLNNLRKLYLSAGYANFGAIPRLIYDDARHTFTLDVDVDQGFPVDFGRLLMEGLEPRAGVAQQLLISWKEIEGKRYNPQLLKDWLKRSEAPWPPGAAARSYISTVSDSSSTLNVLLHFQ
jgi:outer membrane protein assembly factor BamA